MIRRIKPHEIQCLNRIDLSYSAPFGYQYTRRERDDGVHFHLDIVEYDPPFERTYVWDWSDLDDFVQAVERGYVWGSFNTEGDTPLGLVELRPTEWNSACWVQSLYVDQGRRRRGIGSRLISTALREAQHLDARALFIETQNSNGPAIRFYQKHGFTVCGVNDHFYSNNDVSHDEVALFLVRTLPT